MELIKKQGSFTTDLKQIEFLNNIKKCIVNSMNNKFVVSKKLHAKKHESRHIEDIKSEKRILENINYSIEFYNSQINGKQ